MSAMCRLLMPTGGVALPWFGHCTPAGGGWVHALAVPDSWLKGGSHTPSGCALTPTVQNRTEQNADSRHPLLLFSTSLERQPEPSR